MKNNTYKNTTIALIASVIAPFAFAQVSDSAVRADLNNSIEIPDMGMESTLSDLQSIDLSFDGSAVIADVESSTFVTRENALANAEARIEANTAAMAEVQAKVTELKGDAQSLIGTTLNNANTLKAEVMSNIAAVRFASEADFETERDRLIESLEAYDDANAELETSITTA